MSTSASRTRTPWEDRFRTPTYEHLRDQSNKQVAGVFDAARARLLAIPAVRESLVWLGVPWRWSLEYRLALDPVRAWGVLVLQPNRPMIAVPIPSSVLARVQVARLPRSIREGLRVASPVAGVFWPVWECTSRAQVDEVANVMELKRSVLADMPVSNGSAS